MTKHTKKRSTIKRKHRQIKEHSEQTKSQPRGFKMSNEIKELRKRLINDCVNSRKEGNMQIADGIMLALFELDHLDNPYFGTDYSQGDGDDD